MPLNFPAVNAPETTLSLDYTKFFINQTISKKSPIDEFYTVCLELVKLTRPDIITQNPIVTRLLLLGYVSAVEEYLRSIFCEILNLCPLARKNVFDKQIKFGSIDYYERDRLPEGLFESSSLASFDEIRKKTNEFLGVDINSLASLKNALEKFDKICHLRHCAVHSGGTLNAHNAKELELNKEYVKSKLQPDAVTLQEALGVCFSFVRAYNQSIFNKTIDKWVSCRKITGIWKSDKRDFVKLLDILWSTHDNGIRPKENKMYKELLPNSIRNACQVT